MDQGRIRSIRCCAPATQKNLLSGKLLRAGRKEFVPIKHRELEQFLKKLSVNRPTRIFGGDTWFHANAKAIEAAFNPSVISPLVRYFGTRFIPEEAIFQTAFCNQEGLKLCKDNMRYADWNVPDAHPRWLDIGDLSAIKASGAFFARKFRDSKTLDFIDSSLLYAAAPYHIQPH